MFRPPAMTGSEHESRAYAKHDDLFRKMTFAEIRPHFLHVTTLPKRRSVLRHYRPLDRTEVSDKRRKVGEEWIPIFRCNVGLVVRFRGMLPRVIDYAGRRRRLLRNSVSFNPAAVQFVSAAKTRTHLSFRAAAEGRIRRTIAMHRSRHLRKRKLVGFTGSASIVFALILPSARGQNYEITPLVGARFGGTVEINQVPLPHFDAHFNNTVSYGVAGGYRFQSSNFEDHDLIEFRWMRQSTHIYAASNAPAGVVFGRPSISQDNFLADFTHEFHDKDYPAIQPFLTATLGASRLSTPASSTTRFSWGLGAGFKVFPSVHYGFRFKAEYLPTVMYPGNQALVCNGSCTVILNGGMLNQFEISFGPAFRF